MYGRTASVVYWSEFLATDPEVPDRSVGIVRLRTTATKFSLVFRSCMVNALTLNSRAYVSNFISNSSSFYIFSETYFLLALPSSHWISCWTFRHVFDKRRGVNNHSVHPLHSIQMKWSVRKWLSYCHEPVSLKNSQISGCWIRDCGIVDAWRDNHVVNFYNKYLLLLEYIHGRASVWTDFRSICVPVI
jgi:hypothetical protein